MEKNCLQCGRELRCVRTGTTVYIAHTGDMYSADLFACFTCLTFHVYGMNPTPLKAWKDTEKGRVEVSLTPDVVVAGNLIVHEYPKGPFAYLEGDTIPLPKALEYMAEKCGHGVEVAAYLTRHNPIKRRTLCVEKSSR